MWSLCAMAWPLAWGSQGLEAPPQGARLIRMLQREGWQTVALQQARASIASGGRATGLRVLIADAEETGVWWEVDGLLGALGRVPRAHEPAISWRRALAAMDRGEEPLGLLSPRVPRDRAAHLRGVRAALAGESQRATEAFREAGEHARTPASERLAWLNQARVSYASGDLAQAQALLEHVGDGAPLERAWTAFLLGDTERALASLAPLALDRPTPDRDPASWAEGRALQAMVLVDDCRVEEALARLEALVEDSGRQLASIEALLGPPGTTWDPDTLRALWNRLPPRSSELAWVRDAPGVAWVLEKERTLAEEQARAQRLDDALGPWILAMLDAEAVRLAEIGGVQLGEALSDAAAALRTHHDQAEVLQFEVHKRPVAPSEPNLGHGCGR